MKPWRIVVGYVTFSLMALALFAVPLWDGWRVDVGTLRVFVPEDMQALPELFEREGPIAVSAAVRARSDPTRREVVVFAGPDKQVIAGTLSRWPTEIPDVAGTYGHVIDVGDGSMVRVVVSYVPLPGGYRLLMGRESAGLMSLQGRFWFGMGAAAAIVLAFGSILAWVLARRASDAKRSEERYERVMLAAEAGFWDWDVVADDCYISPKLLEMGVFPPGSRFAGKDDLLSRAPLHPDDLPKWEGAIKALFASSDTRLAMEIRVLRGAEARWANVSGMCVRDGAGKVVRWTGSATDITERKRAEEALRESQERYALAVAGSDDGVWDLDFIARQVFVSARSRELMGMLPGPEMIPWEEWSNSLPLHPDDLPRRTAAFNEHLEGRTPAYIGEFRLRQLDGTYRWRRIRGLCVRNADGQPSRMAGSISDIDDRRRAEEALRHSEQGYELAMEAAQDAHWDWDMVTGEYYVSPRTTQLHGFAEGTKFATREEHLAASPYLPEDQEAWLHATEKLFAGTGDRLSMEQRATVRGEIRWFQRTGVCKRNAAGKPIRWSGSVRDVTDQRRAVDALRLSEERYSLALDASGEGHFDIDVATDSLYSSDRMLYEIFGYPPGTRFKTRSDFMQQFPFYGSDGEIYRSEVERVMVKGGPDHYEFEFRIVRPTNEVRWLWTRAKITRDAEGNTVRRAGVCRDITATKLGEVALREMEEELRRAQRLEAVGTLAGGIAHDFNNILGAILGYGEMATRDAKIGTRLRRDLDSIMAAGERGRALIDRILAFSRSGVGERIPVHVEAVVSEALSQVTASVPGNISITHRLRAGRAAMLGDSTQVHQLVMNLASNAVHAMPQGGVLHVALDTAHMDAERPAVIGAIRPGDYIVLRVSDTGTGIPQTVQEQMFDPFFTTKEVGVGSGLGLSLVHGIVTSVAGAIDVSTVLGKGTVFTVFLRRSGDAPEQPLDEDQPLQRGEGQRVLVLDDEEPLVRLAIETLEDLGYAPIGFTSSTAALAAFRADPGCFDAVLTDERMPGLSGSALIREVRRIREEVPVVLMSGYLGMESLDADVVIRKPLSARDLAVGLARALAP